MAALAVFIDIFTGNNSIVDDYSQGDDKGEHGDDIDRDSHGGEKKQAAKEGDRDSHGHPESQLEFEKQAEQKEYQYQTDASVLQQQVETLLIDFGAVAVDAPVDSVRQVSLDFRHCRTDGP